MVTLHLVFANGDLSRACFIENSVIFVTISVVKHSIELGVIIGNDSAYKILFFHDSRFLLYSATGVFRME